MENINNINLGLIIAVLAMIVTAVGYIQKIKSWIEAPFKEFENKINSLEKNLEAKVDNMNDKVEVLQKANCNILLDRILQLKDIYVKQKYATDLQKKQLEEMCKSYKDLGGDGVAEAARNEVLSLPSNKKESKKLLVE